MMTSGEKIKALRLSKGREWTQTKLAAELKKHGAKDVTMNRIANIEIGRSKRLFPDELLALSKVFGKEFDYFEDDLRDISTPYPESRVAEDGTRFYQGPAPGNFHVIQVPIVGKASASGCSYEPEGAPLGFLPLPLYAPASGKLYALQVTGSCMEPTAHDGDYIITRDPDGKPRDGTLVVAEVDGGILLKRVFHAGERVELRPDNKSHKPVVVAGKAVRILGVVYRIISVREP